jgi:hypothetical protein
VAGVPNVTEGEKEDVPGRRWRFWTAGERLLTLAAEKARDVGEAGGNCVCVCACVYVCVCLCVCMYVCVCLDGWGAVVDVGCGEGA